ncbi:MAG TPA: C39 family peptidase [Candidatus Paceibacterota bacterium]
MNSFFILLSIAFLSLATWQYVEAREARVIEEVSAIEIPQFEARPQVVILPVPFIRQTPDGDWSYPWNNACEEAVIMMAERFYQGDTRETISGTETRELLPPLFKIQEKIWGSNKDSNAERTLRIIKEFDGAFDATIKTNPTLEELKAELKAGHPIISLHYGIGLDNPEHIYVKNGSGYHMILLVGYDDDTREFLANDPEGPSGRNWRYSYDTIMETLGDYNHQTYKVEDTPTVLFTQPRD